MKSTISRRVIYYLIVLILLCFTLAMIFLRGLYFVLPNEEAVSFINTNPITRILINTDYRDQDHAIFNLIYDIVFLLASTITLFTSWTLTRGRSIAEIVGLLLAFAIPRRRKNWGSVFDASNGSFIPFATILLIKKEKEKTVVKEIISDFEGKYRLGSSSKDENLYIQVKSPGYSIFEKPISSMKERSFLGDIIQDIYLKPEGGKSYKQRYLRSLRNRIYSTYSIPLLFSTSGIAVIVTWILLLGIPDYLRLLEFLIAFSGFIWNIYIIRKFSKVKSSTALDQITNLPIAYVLINVFKDKKQVFSVVSDENGEIRLPIKGGNYILDISKQGYLPLKNFKIRLSSQGTFNENIYLVRDYAQTPTPGYKSKIDNPFSSRLG